MTEQLLRDMNREIGEVSTKIDAILSHQQTQTIRLNDHADRLRKVEKHTFGIKAVGAAFAAVLAFIGWDKITDLLKGGG